MTRSGLTQQDVNRARDGEVKNGCLLLTKQKYEPNSFQTRKDFKFVIAKNLKLVSSFLFKDSALQVPFMPEVESINLSAFSNCPLTAICFLKVKSVETWAFHDCKDLSKVFLPACQKLGLCCFMGCKNIKVLDLPKVKTVGKKQFGGCSSLADLLIPSAEEIGRDCFYGCEVLESVWSKLNANQFVCDDECRKSKLCVACRGQLEDCLRRWNDEQNRLRVQKEMEEQKLDLLKEFEAEPVEILKIENAKPNIKIQLNGEQTKDLILHQKAEQIEDRREQNRDLNGL